MLTGHVRPGDGRASARAWARGDAYALPGKCGASAIACADDGRHWLTKPRNRVRLPCINPAHANTATVLLACAMKTATRAAMRYSASMPPLISSS